MVEYIVGFLLHGIDHGSVFDHDGFQAFHTDILQATQAVDRVENVDNAIETLAEGIEFPEDVILTLKKKRNKTNVVQHAQILPDESTPEVPLPLIG